MSLYDEAILIQKPSGYKAGKLYNVIPSPEVSEQSSLEFDGVDDCLITDGDSVAQPTTYSFWAKSTETGGNTGVFGHGGNSKGGFHFNYGDTQPLLYLGSSYYRYWADISEQDDGEWHHWVVYSDTNDITNSKLYVDGVLQTASSTNSSGSTSAYTEGLTIGSDQQSSGNYFNGSISDFAVFGSELSAADVKEIYNYGSPNDLLETSFVNDLDLYYQMGDGILDEYPLIADQTDATLGSELVTNGTFDTDASGWGSDSGAAVDWQSDSTLLVGNDGGDNTYATTQTSVLVSGKTYKVSFRFKPSGSGTLRVRLGGSGTTFTTESFVVDAWNDVEFFGTADNTTLEIGSVGGNITNFYLDNVSVKQVQGNPATMTNMSSDDIVAWTPNLETDFDVARSSWTTRINASGYIEQVAPNVPRLNYDSDDSCPYLLTEDAGTNLITYPISFGNSYWTKSGASVVGDSSTAGSELVTNGNFEDGSTDWYVGTGWTISGGTANCDGTQSGNADLKQNITTYTGKQYKITYTVSNYSAGNIFIRLNSSNVSPAKSSNGTFSEILSGEGGIQVTLRANLDFIGSVDNVSVKEVQGFEAPKEIPVANGEELVTNGDFEDGNTDWDKNSDWTIASGVATSSGVSNNRIFQTSLLSSDTTYCYSFDKTRVSGTSIIIQYYTGSGYVNIDEISSTGATTETGHFTTGTSNGTLYFKAQGSWVGSIDNISVKEATSYSGGGLEREAYKLVEDTSTGSHKVHSVNVSVTNGNNHTVSMFVKAAERNWIRLSSANGGYAYFDLENGVAGTLFNATTNIEAIANGWYRCDVTYTSGSTTSTCEIRLADADNSYSYTGDGTSGVYIAYAQLEENTYASSLMLPTTEGSTTSRVADAITGGGNQSLFSGVNSSGVLYAEIAANSDDGTIKHIEINDGSGSDYVVIEYYAVSNGIRAIVFNNGATQASLTTTISDITDYAKIAVKWNENDFALWVNGAEVATDNSGTTFSANTLNEIMFQNSAGSFGFYGKTKGLAVFDYLSDDEMETLTT